MLGIAQRLFTERRGTRPWQSAPATDLTRWPTLERLMAMGCPIGLEVALARQLLAPFSEAPEAAAAFLCHLCLAARQGHLCVSAADGGVYPAPAKLWLEAVFAKAELVNPELLESVSALIEAGAALLPQDLVGTEADTGKAVVTFQSCYYLKRFWDYESLVAAETRRLLAAPPSPALDHQRLSQHAANLTKERVLNGEQATAIVQAGLNVLTLITGGPGTGKTYVAGHLIQVLLETLDDSAHFEIVAAAPTGKAAANLTASLSRVLSALPNPPQIKAKTLHSLLGVNRRNQDAMSWLTADLIIVDESSMVDVQLMARLLKSIKNGARVVLLGDSDQLPAVEAGGVFADLVAVLDRGHVVRLEKCHRTESLTILSAAASIRDGDAGKLREVLMSGADGVQLRLWPDDDVLIWNAIKSQCQALLMHAANDSLKMLQAMNRFRILTPLREGPWGVEDINDRLLLWAQQQSGGAPLALPIMVTVNDYSKDLFNGDVGVLVGNIDQPYALFADGDGVRTIPEVALPRYEYAFALSVHKSQGSEFDNVLLLLPERSEVFGREMVYTAVTRAKQSIEIWSAPEVMDNLLKHRMQRLSGLRHRSM